MTFTPKKYQLITNVFQAAILCLFNDSTETTNAQIVQRTQLSQELFKAAMMRFCAPQVKLLLKENAKKPVFEPNEKIKINPQFASNSIRCNLIPQKVVKKKTAEATPEESAQAK